jgi:hypothetical protein
LHGWQPVAFDQHGALNRPHHPSRYRPSGGKWRLVDEDGAKKLSRPACRTRQLSRLIVSWSDAEPLAAD